MEGGSNAAAKLAAKYFMAQPRQNGSDVTSVGKGEEYSSKMDVMKEA